MSAHSFDLLVIGSGPAGQKAAIAASKLGKSAAIVDRRHLLGGVSLHSGTIPSKTLREAILYFTGYRQRSFFGTDYMQKDKITVADLKARVGMVIEREMSVVVSQLRRNRVEILHGVAKFVDDHTVRVESEEGAQDVRGEKILIACGTRPARSPDIVCDGRTIMVADQLGGIEALPAELIVVGGGVVGLEYASMFATLGIRVTVIDQRPNVLEFADREIIDALIVNMRSVGTTFRLGEKVTSVTHDPRGRVVALTESGKRIQGEALLYTVGRQVNTDTLGLDVVGLKTGPRGHLEVNGAYQTAVPHIYAAGDVIGAPALAATGMEQARAAMTRALGSDLKRDLASLLPAGIYSIPEVGAIGATEEALRTAEVDYVVGRWRAIDSPRGRILGDEHGLLKLLFRRSDLRLLGAHVIGEQATETVHVGMMAMLADGDAELFNRACFNYPTLGDLYKYASYEALLQARGRI
jgi:NAD(P) transhydrogenase